MKRIYVTVTAQLWVPEGFYQTPMSLDMLANSVRQTLHPAMDSLGAGTDRAITNITVNVEMPNDRL